MIASLSPHRVVATYADYLRMPDDGKRYEIIDGELALTPAPLIRHQAVSGNLLFTLYAHVKKHDLGQVYNAPVDVVLSSTDVVQPDLVFVSTSRMGIVTERAVQGPPDLVVEILSPSNKKRDNVLKTQLYAHYRVPNYWIVDPAAASLRELVLRDDQTKYALRGTHLRPEHFVSAVFPKLRIHLTALFE